MVTLDTLQTKPAVGRRVPFGYWCDQQWRAGQQLTRRLNRQTRAHDVPEERGLVRRGWKELLLQTTPNVWATAYHRIQQEEPMKAAGLYPGAPASWCSSWSWSIRAAGGRERQRIWKRERRHSSQSCVALWTPACLRRERAAKNEMLLEKAAQAQRMPLALQFVDDAAGVGRTFFEDVDSEAIWNRYAVGHGVERGIEVEVR